MSSNRTSTNKQDSRIAQKEAMVTRHKSAQMKRQLRTKDRSMKHLTNLLKSPTKETQTAARTVPVKKKQSPPKVKQSLLKSVERVQNLPQKTFKLSKVIRKEVILIPDEEYYPNKLKRKLAIKKVVLKPKNALKLVGEITGSVKRKCAVPVKASDSQDSQEDSPMHRLSMAEAMSIMDDQLTDEDLMEILTCPSPVWWEDPPDEDYIEDAIFTRPRSGVQPPAEPMEIDTDKMENDTSRIIVIPNLSSKGDKFLKKRSKLEDLLGNIKDKSKDTRQQSSSKDIFNEDVVVLCSNYRTDTDGCKVNDNNYIRSRSRHSESDDEIMFNNSMNEDELLKDLENMDIPIAKRRRSSDVIIIDDDDDDICLDKPTKSKEANIKETQRNENNEKTVVNDIGSVRENKTNKVKTSRDNTVLNRKLSKEMSSPKSSDSCSSKSSVVFVQDADSISDTNIKFLEEHIDNDEVTDSNDNTAGTSIENTDKTNNNESKESNKEAADENVTVYQIIEEISEDSSGNMDSEQKRVIESKLETYYEILPKEKGYTNEKSVQAKVNDFYKKNKANADDEDIQSATKTSDYKRIKVESDLQNVVQAKLSVSYKKCKRAYQKKSKKNEKSDINKNDIIQNADEIDNFPTMFCESCKPSFKKVSEDEDVKYCLNCSSIFDTKECTYCSKKLKNKIYICIPCKIKFCCDNFYKTHEKQGCSDKTISRKVVFTQLPEKGTAEGSPNVQVINYYINVNGVDVS